MKRPGISALALTVSLVTFPLALSAQAPQPAAAPTPAPPAGSGASAPLLPKSLPLPETVAVVEGVEIKKGELETAFATGLAQQNIPAESISEAERPQIFRMILDSLIAQKLVQKRAAGIQISDAEVNTMMADLTKKFGSEEMMKTMMEQRGMTPEKLKQDIRMNLQEQRWLDEQVKDKGEVTDADADTFYKANPAAFQRPEEVRASHILVSVPEDAKPEVIAEKEKAAQAIAARVKKGEAFDKLARELSEDPSAKENSGDLNYFTREQMVPEFSEAAFKMKKDEISAPVRSKFGFHVIKVVDHRTAGPVSLEEAKPRLLAHLKQQKRQEEVQKVVQGLRDKAEVKINLPGASPATATTPPIAVPAAPVTATTPPVSAPPASPSPKKP